MWILNSIFAFEVQICTLQEIDPTEPRDISARKAEFF